MEKVVVNKSSLENIGDAIRLKNGSDTHYKPSEMGSAISSLETSAEPVLESITITENGNYSTTDDIDGYDEIIVDVSGGTGEIVLSGNLRYSFTSNSQLNSVPACNKNLLLNSVLESGISIRTEDVTDFTYAFHFNNISEIPFVLNANDALFTGCFNNCQNLSEIAGIEGSINQISYAFQKTLLSNIDLRDCFVETTHMISSFASCYSLENIYGDIYIGDSTSSSDVVCNISECFMSCEKLKTLPTLHKGTSEGISIRLYPNINKAFYQAKRLNNIDCFEIFDVPTTTTSNNINNSFYYCCSLRRIPSVFLKIPGLWNGTNASYSPYGNMFSNDYVLDEIPDIAVCAGTTSSSSLFNSCVNSTYRLKKFTFETNSDGSAKQAKFKSAVLDFAGSTGWATSSDMLLEYSQYHGITNDTCVTNAETYQALKNNPDWWTTKAAYSRYNHNSAVETINSLPDTSAYGTNTIKFYGEAGSLTDGGAIRSLTDAEIAVAAAKGWTVTLV